MPTRIAKSPERWLKKLRRWRSMPTSQIAPSNRPLFACRRCAAVNVHGVICTWCGHSCDSIRDTPTARRRVSAPQLLTDAQKEQLRLIEKNAAIVRTLLASQAGPPPEVPPAAKRHRNRDAAIYTLNATTGMVRTNGKAKVFVRSSIVSAVEAASPPASPVSPTFSIGDQSETRATPSPLRTLRRRKRMSVTRRRSSRSLRSKSSKGALPIAPLSEKIDLRPATPESSRTGRTVASFPTSSPPRAAVSARLGSPSRPLYTAIRKRLDSDSSFFSVGSVRSGSGPCQPAPERPTSITSEPPLSESDEDDMDIKDLLPMAPSRSHFRASSGCSLSGETELRMALSRQRSKTVGGPRPEYIYHDREHHKDFTSLMQTMKKISQGMKSLVRSRDG